jgi:hypothetical protein
MVTRLTVTAIQRRSETTDDDNVSAAIASVLEDDGCGVDLRSWPAFAARDDQADPAMMREPQWDTLEDLFRQVRLAFRAQNDNQFQALVYMLRLNLEDLKEAYECRPRQGGFVYPAGSEEVQAEAVRADRGADRPGDTA